MNQKTWIRLGVVGGLIVTKAFNALDENWVTVYSPKDAVGQAGDWNEPLVRARALEQRMQQFMQQRWLQLFIRAGEAVARRDSNDFAQAVRELKRNPISLAASSSNPQSQNFFTAK